MGLHPNELITFRRLYLKYHGWTDYLSALALLSQALEIKLLSDLGETNLFKQVLR